MNVSACVNEILVRGLDDWIQAAEVASIARTLGGAKGDDEIREVSMEIVCQVLDRKLMEIGDVSQLGFQSWRVSLSEVLARIDAAWRRRYHEPNLGDLFWLNLPDLGQRTANEVCERAKTCR